MNSTTKDFLNTLERADTIERVGFALRLLTGVSTDRCRLVTPTETFLPTDDGGHAEVIGDLIVTICGEPRWLPNGRGIDLSARCEGEQISRLEAHHNAEGDMVGYITRHYCETCGYERIG